MRAKEDEMADECKCVVLDATTEGGGTDPRSCPEHAYEAGRRHERNVYLAERAELVAELTAKTTRLTLAISVAEAARWACVAVLDQDTPSVEMATIRPMAAELLLDALKVYDQDNVDRGLG
jgi:hypothetical protein